MAIIKNKKEKLEPRPNAGARKINSNGSVQPITIQITCFILMYFELLNYFQGIVSFLQIPPWKFLHLQNAFLKYPMVSPLAFFHQVFGRALEIYRLL